MRVACLGGGPGGLYFAISMKLQDPSHEVVVFERNRADDTFGWGVVLSDETLANLAKNDPASAKAIGDNFAYWDDIALLYRGQRHLSSGHGFCGIGRRKLLLLLQDRARELGVELRFETEIEDSEALRSEFDIVVAADGLNSKTRQLYAEKFKPEIDLRHCQFVWLGTHQTFAEAFTFIFEETEHGWVWAHAYQFDDSTATFIVECSQETFEAFEFANMSQQECISVCEEIFKDHLGGHGLMTNANHKRGSAWIRFPRVLCETWHYENVVLLGTPLPPLTSRLVLAPNWHSKVPSRFPATSIRNPDLATAYARYQDERRLEVLRLQSAARNSMEWFESVERYLKLDPVQLNYSMLTRSQRISHENLRLRDPKWMEAAERWFQNNAGISG